MGCLESLRVVLFSLNLEMLDFFFYPERMNLEVRFLGAGFRRAS